MHCNKPERKYSDYSKCTFTKQNGGNYKYSVAIQQTGIYLITD